MAISGKHERDSTPSGEGPVTYAPGQRTPQTPPDRVPVRRRFVTARTSGDGLTVKRRLTRKAFRLNNTGKVIWSLCDGQTAVTSICELLERTFQGAEGSLRQDVMRTLSKLEEYGLLTFRDAPRKRRATKRLDLRKILFYVINCRSDTAKRDRMRHHLSELGLRFEFVDGVECTPGIIGCTISQFRLLNQRKIETPFAVLEDDCRFNENFRYELMVPANTDALYLGVSRFGIELPGQLSWGKFDHVQWSRYDAHNLRVFNMLASHAIVYLSEDFRQAAFRAVLNALTHPDYPYPVDVGLASTHLSHLVLTPLLPICYQASELGGQQGATEKALSEV